ncbi:MAG: low molecular weight protein arginine phosphatase [Verrucomicrobiota bacterium]|nr:low molecular weight protein arginine phosphatase [Verrucomicrobiota bacterium]
MSERKTKQLLFVCSGNVCRSPIAEHLLRARLGPRSEWTVASAGLSAWTGMPASQSAIDALRERGIDMTGHRSRALDRERIDASSVIVVMTNSHRDQIRRLYPEAVERVFLLRSFDPAAEDEDLEDPIGGSPEQYRRVRDQIEAALPDLIAFAGRLEGDHRRKLGGKPEPS